MNTAALTSVTTIRHSSASIPPRVGRVFVVSLAAGGLIQWTEVGSGGMYNQETTHRDAYGRRHLYAACRVVTVLDWKCPTELGSVSISARMTRGSLTAVTQWQPLKHVNHKKAIVRGPVNIWLRTHMHGRAAAEYGDTRAQCTLSTRETPAARLQSCVTARDYQVRKMILLFGWALTSVWETFGVTRLLFPLPHILGVLSPMPWSVSSIQMAGTRKLQQLNMMGCKIATGWCGSSVLLCFWPSCLQSHSQIY